MTQLRNSIGRIYSKKDEEKVTDGEVFKNMDMCG